MSTTERTLAYVFSDAACPHEAASTLQWAVLENGSQLKPLGPADYSQIEKLAKGPADQSIVTWLKKNNPESLKGRDIPLNQQLLRFIAGSAKLFFRGKRLICDLFSKNTLIFRVRKNAENKWILTGHIKEKDREIDIKSCDAVRPGNPPGYIRQGQLKFLDDEIGWNRLKALFTGGEIIIDSTWKEYLDALRGQPNLDLNDPSFFTADDPLPQIILTDRTGAFATLQMDYGNGRIVTYMRGHQFTTTQTFRKLQVEKQWEADLLETDFIWKPTGKSQYYCFLDKVNKSLKFLLELGWKVFDSHGNQVRLCNGMEWKAEASDTQIMLRSRLVYDNYEASLKEAVGSFNRNERFISLGEGTVGLLPDRFSDLGVDAIALEGEWVGDAITLPKARAGLLNDLLAKEESFEIPVQLRTLCCGNKNEALIEEVKIPDTFSGTLRHYQQVGVNWLSFLYKAGLHGLLADDMGLGKTVQVIAFLACSGKQANPTLIVAPTSLLHNWKAEIARFYPDASVYIHHGPRRDVNAWTTDVILTTYATLRQDSLLFHKQDFHCVVLDESHTIKNAYTQTAKSAFNLSSRFKISITGTPVENNIQELWSQFYFLMPGLLGSINSFQSEIEAGTVDPRFIARIRKQIRPFMLRRTKKEVAPDLPEKIEQTVWVEMEPAQRSLYDSFLAGARKNLLTKVKEDGAGKHRIEILEVLLRLRQICCDPKLVGAKHEEALEVPSAKMQMIMEDIDSLAQEGAKVLIYSQFTSLLGLVRGEMEKAGLEYLYLDGQTRDRGVVVERFQNDEKMQFFLISLKAGGVGLNLTAADYVLLLDPWWNEAAEQQAIDRAHRIGRTGAVIAKRYVMLDTVEEKMMQVKERKKKLATDLFEDQGQEAFLTADDFEWILS